jgi:hypothetical protein
MIGALVTIAGILIFWAIFAGAHLVIHLGECAKQLKRIADAAEKRNDLYCKKEGINRFK